uniref:tyrosine-type recombinase/integrase n=1 Tax=Limnohabitans sp. TaxID=1907725 RepID=UPI0040470854
MTGTANGDTFAGSLTTVGAGDTLDGGDGTDTLNVEINTPITSKFTTTSIENINITSYGAQAVDTKGMTGVEKIATAGSTGAITLNNLGSATTALGFAGASTNNITANYTAGVLSGTGDTLGVELNAAKAVALVTSAGFEGLKITATGANDITTLTVPGVNTITIGGTGSVNVKNQLTGVSTLNAAGMSGALTSGTPSTTTGIVDQSITAASTGATLLLGSGADNIGFANTAAATAGSTIKAGAGNDIVQVNAAGNGAVIVFGEAGDDTIGSVTSVLATVDVLDGGDGNDTVRLDGTLANNGMVLLSHIFNVAIRLEQVPPDTNPCKGVAMFKETQRERYLSQGELAALFAELDRNPNILVCQLVRLLLYTGARKRELLDARWDEVDFTRRVLWVPPERSKSKRRRPIALSNEAIEILKALPRADGVPYVFFNPQTAKPPVSVFVAWDSIRKRAGIPDFRMHDLRHSFASFLVNAGRSLYDVQRLLGHHDPKVTMRYAHLSQQTMVEASDAAASTIAALLGPRN